MLPPKDVLPEIGDWLSQGLASKKWKDRKAALERLIGLVSAPRLAPATARI